MNRFAADVHFERGDCALLRRVAGQHQHPLRRARMWRLGSCVTSAKQGTSPSALFAYKRNGDARHAAANWFETAGSRVPPPDGAVGEGEEKASSRSAGCGRSCDMNSCDSGRRERRLRRRGRKANMRTRNLLRFIPGLSRLVRTLDARERESRLLTEECWRLCKPKPPPERTLADTPREADFTPAKNRPCRRTCRG